MESGAILDTQITASSVHDDRYAASYGRLHFQHHNNEMGAWAADRNDNQQWLQIDLGSEYFSVTRVATQGRNSNPGVQQWVTKYKLQYSDDGAIFQYYREQGKNTEKVKLHRG